MKINDFKTLSKYLGNDAYAYLVIKKNKFLEPSDWRSQLYAKLKEVVPHEKLVFINVNVHSDGTISLQSISKTTKSNALLLRRDVLLDFFGSQLEIDYGIAKKIIFIKDKSYIDRQGKRKVDAEESLKVKKEKKEQNVKSILNGNKTYIPKNEWITANKEVLKQKSTICERMVFNKLRKALKNRVNKQIPFTINGNIYFTDICIKSKKLIVEIDGGYHNIESVKNKDNRRDADFQSIGYTTLRIKNEEVLNSKMLSEFVNKIIAIPNCSKLNAK